MKNQRGKKVITPTWTATNQRMEFDKNVMSIIACSTWWSPWPSSTKTTAPSSLPPTTSPLPKPARQRRGRSAGSEGWDLSGFYRPVIKICKLYFFCLYLFNWSVMKVFRFICDRYPINMNIFVFLTIVLCVQNWHKELTAEVKSFGVQPSWSSCINTEMCLFESFYILISSFPSCLGTLWAGGERSERMMYVV